MSSSHHEISTPNLLINPPSLPSSASTRRVPPPCWSHDETVALLDAYRDKWYSLRRGNLRAHHWQEVADEIASKFPMTPKTSVQCRHKMEKLRKRYRGEKQRAAAAFGRRFKSAWVHFKRMDYMERGPDAKEDEDDEDEEQDDVTKSVGGIYRNNINSENNKFGINEKGNVIMSTPTNNGLNGYRIRLPVRSVPVVAQGGKLYNNYDEFGVPNSQIRDNFRGSKKVLRGGMGMKKNEVDEKKRMRSSIGEMVEAIRDLGQGFVRAERMKVDMAREIEEMRMEMELKRTEMILESQQQIVDAFARNVFGSVSK